MVSAFFCACDQSDSSGNTEKEELQNPQPEGGVFIKQGVDTLLQSDSLLNSFAPSWSVAEALASLPDAAITERKAVQNRHVSGQIDTLLELGNGRSEVHFYRLPNQDLLQYANIQDAALPFGKGLVVGVSADALAQLLPPLSGKDTLPEQIVLEGKLVPRSLKIRLGKGAV